MDKKLKLLREAWKLLEEERKITLYHGGNLKGGYLDSVTHKKGRWEYGPGLYLTTHYETASNYAKGSRKLYKVTIEEGNNLEDVMIDSEAVKEFIKSFVKVKNRRDIIDRLDSKWERDGNYPADIFVNLIINDDAIKPAYTNYLRKFLVEHGADYSIVSNAFGWGKIMVVLFNLDKITNIEETKDYDDLPDEFS